MPDPSQFPMDQRPDYGFTEFDALLTALDEVPEALREEIHVDIIDKTLDRKALRKQHHLPPPLIARLEQLQRWGDEDLGGGQPFGSIRIATVNAGSDGMCDLTTHVFATRSGRAIEYSWRDENDGEGELGVRDLPLTMGELIPMVDQVLLAQEGYIRGDWRRIYLCDEAMTVQVESRLYPDLARWYETTIDEWRAAHPAEEEEEEEDE